MRLLLSLPYGKSSPASVSDSHSASKSGDFEQRGGNGRKSGALKAPVIGKIIFIINLLF